MTKKYHVSIPWHCSVMVEVEADSIAEAMEKASEEVNPSICHQCSDNVEMGEAATEYFTEDCVSEIEQ